MVFTLRADRDVSSSDAEAASTSLRSEERNDGPGDSFSMRDRGEFARAIPFDLLELAIAGVVDDDTSGRSGTRRVRGRFSFRSGSLGSAFRGEEVNDLDFRFRLLGVAVSTSFALSRAPQAIFSSLDSTGVGTSGVRGRSTGAAALNAFRAPWRLAILRRCCHCRNCLLSFAVERWCCR